MDTYKSNHTSTYFKILKQLNKWISTLIEIHVKLHIKEVAKWET